MELFKRIYGEGQPVIMLHGLFGMSDNFVSIAKKMAARFEVILPDLRNHGQSPHSFEMNYTVMCEDIFEMIQKYNINNPVILGHSMGGKVAMTFSLRHQEMLSKLILVDISPAKYTEHYEHRDLIRAMQSLDLKKVRTYAEIEKQLENILLSVRLKQFLIKNIKKESKESDQAFVTNERQHNNFVWKFGMEEILSNVNNLLEGVTSDLHFNKPVLIIKGGVSHYIKDEDNILFRKLFSNSIITTIPDVTHWVHADKPELFRKIVEEFISNSH